MADQEQKALRYYAMPSVNEATSSIRRLAIHANNFEIEPAIIQMIQQTVQFEGLSQEDPNLHIANFLEIYDTFKHNGVTDDAIRLRLFPFSLRDKSKVWLNCLPPSIITTWEELAQKFLAKYFPPAKTAKLRNDITTSSNLRVNHYMKHGRGTKIYCKGVLIMTFQYGFKCKHSTTV